MRQSGETAEEALSNIREAIRCYVESALKHGESIPEEMSAIEYTVEIEDTAGVPA